MSDQEADVTPEPVIVDAHEPDEHTAEPAVEAAPEPEPTPEPVPDPPKVNVILEYRDQPGEAHLAVWLDVMEGPRPFSVQYAGRTFTQARQIGDLWVYAG